MARPIMIAIGGDSGSGKSTLGRGIHTVFGSQRVVEVCLDDYHALDRAQRAAAGLTALDPRANDFTAMEDDVQRLARGEPVVKPVYDHTNGTFGRRQTLEPRDIVIVHGLFPLYTSTLRALFDVSVWLDPEPELKVRWKVQRDTAQRGYTREEVHAEITKRRPDIEAFIDPQKAYADLCVRFARRAPGGDAAELDARIVKGERFKPLDYDEFASGSTHFRQLAEGDGPFPRTIIELDGDMDEATASVLQRKIRNHMGARHLASAAEPLGVFDDRRGARVSHTLALAQLLIARRICLVADALAATAAA